MIYLFTNKLTDSVLSLKSENLNHKLNNENVFEFKRDSLIHHLIVIEEIVEIRLSFFYILQTSILFFCKE